jgi:signal transduction histidine kinase
MVMPIINIKKMKLQARFFFYFTSLVVLIVLFVSITIYYFQKGTLLHQAQEKAISMTGTLASTSLNAIIQDDYIVLQSLIDAIDEGPDIIFITILDTTGKVIAADVPERRGQTYSDPIIEELLASETPIIKKVTTGDNLWDAACPIYRLNERLATARLRFTVEDTYHGLLKTILFIGLIAIFISLLLSYKFSRDISKPIKEVVNLADQYGKGNLKASIENQREDEIGQLVHSLNKLSNDLKSMIEEKITNESMVLIGEFAAYIIHDLKNPLSGIRLLSDGLHRRIPEDNALKKFSTELLLAVQKLQDFVGKTLDISRWSRLDIQNIELHRLIDDTLATVNNSAIKITKTYDNNMQPIRGDYRMLEMAIKNILWNAVEAIENNGHIHIETECNTKVHIIISDTGIGISGERLHTIFRPFYSKKENGHGLGLAMVKKAVIMHQGNIEVESKVNVGTKFIITLPQTLPEYNVPHNNERIS